MVSEYVHGYSDTEAFRLQDQAGTLSEMLHGDTRYRPGTSVLEIGCGVGAQTGILARNSPSARITSVDISMASLQAARKAVEGMGCGNVGLVNADLYQLPFLTGTFDQVFVCFVLEHLPDPVGALIELKALLRPGGGITIIEGDHGSCFFHPRSEAAERSIDCLVRHQEAAGGDSLIGRRLYPLVSSAGYKDVRVSPRMVYVDSSRPELVDGFTRKTFIAMVKGVRDDAISSGTIESEDFDHGIADLERTTEKDGTFCYTFFKCTATR